MPRPSRRPFASLVFAVVLLAGTVTPALGWANGGNLGNAYGTHDWIVSQAVKVFGDNPPAWLDLNAALLATDDPDKVFWATNEHVFNEKGYGRGAVDRITEFYHQALLAHQAGDDQTASITFGWMAHYYGDILQPYHTNYAAVHLGNSHLHYEQLVGKVTRSPDASPEWSTANRTPKAVADVRTTAIRAAAFSRKYFPELHSLFKVDETLLTPRVAEITGFVLKRAIVGPGRHPLFARPGRRRCPSSDLGQGDRQIPIRRQEHHADRLRHGEGSRRAATRRRAGGRRLPEGNRRNDPSAAIHDQGRDDCRVRRHRSQSVRRATGCRGNRQDGGRRHDRDDVVHDQPALGRWLGRVQVVGQRHDRVSGADRPCRIDRAR